MKFPLFLTTLNVSRLVIIGSYLFFLLLLHHHIHSIFSITISITITIPSSPFPIFTSYLYLLSFTFFFSSLSFMLQKSEKSIIIIRCNLFLVQKDLMLINKMLDLD